MENVKPSRNIGLDAVRGIAAVMVVATHASQIVSPNSSYLIRLAGGGVTGVHIFFIVSTISLLISVEFYKATKSYSYFSFLIRRFFRIAPLFWITATFFLFHYGLGPRNWRPDGILFQDVALTFSLLFGLHPLLVNAIHPIGWSVAVEWLFYLIFPFILKFISGIGGSLLLLISSIILSDYFVGFALHTYSDLYESDFRNAVISFATYMSLPAAMPYFSAGFLIFYLMKSRIFFSNTYSRLFLLFLFAFFIIYPAFPEGYFSSRFSGSSLRLAFIVIFVLAFSGLKGNRFTSFLAYIGQFSYGIYLIHYIVIESLSMLFWRINLFPMSGDSAFWVFFLLVLSLTVILSGISYYLLERPLSRYGNMVARRTTLLQG